MILFWSLQILRVSGQDVLVVGGFGGFGETKAVDVELVNSHGRRVCPNFPPLPQQLDKAGAVFFMGEVVICGGQADIEEDFRARGECLSLSPGESSWRLLTNMTEPRSQHSVNVLDDSIVVAGGVRKSSTNRLKNIPVTSIEIYNSKSKNWATIPWIPIFGHCATFLEKDLYFLGGRHNDNYPYQYVESVVVLKQGAFENNDQKQQTDTVFSEKHFETSALLPIQVLAPGCTTFGKDIYMAGGYLREKIDGSSKTNRMFVLRDGVWTEGPPMKHKRNELTLFIIAGRLTAIGGGPENYPDLTLQRSIERLGESGAWTPAGALQTARSRHSAVTLPEDHGLCAGNNMCLQSVE